MKWNRRDDTLNTDNINTKQGNPIFLGLNTCEHIVHIHTSL
jgi:hypothetical protein